MELARKVLGFYLRNQQPNYTVIGDLYNSVRFSPQQRNVSLTSVRLACGNQQKEHVIPKYPDLGGHVLAFILTSTKEPKDFRANQYLGPPNVTCKTESSSWILAVEFNIIQNPDFQDINDNHVEIDISSLISNISEPAAYYNSIRKEDNYNNSIILKSGNPIQAWVDYKSQEMLINISISPLGLPRPYCLIGL
nr:l-type lectin-domain containing receptor kinase s.4 [Quercus suber]